LLTAGHEANQCGALSTTVQSWGLDIAVLSTFATTARARADTAEVGLRIVRSVHRHLLEVREVGIERRPLRDRAVTWACLHRTLDGLGKRWESNTSVGWGLDDVAESSTNTTTAGLGALSAPVLLRVGATAIARHGGIEILVCIIGGPLGNKGVDWARAWVASNGL